MPARLKRGKQSPMRAMGEGDEVDRTWMIQAGRRRGHDDLTLTDIQGRQVCVLVLVVKTF